MGEQGTKAPDAKGAAETLVASLDRSSLAAENLKALAHPLRLRIVALLCGADESVGRMADRLGVRQSTVSQQLRILRMHGLVGSARSNGHAHYRLTAPHLRDLIGCIGDLAGERP